MNAPIAGKFSPGFHPYPQPGAGKRLSSQTTCSLPETPILLQRPAQPRPPACEPVPPRLDPGQSPDPHKHLFDLGAAAPPLGHLSHSINSRFTGARAHAPNPFRRSQARPATGTSPGALRWRASLPLAPSPIPHGRGGARQEPGATRVGPRARCARLTKSGAAPCGRATRDPAGAWASCRDLEQGSHLPRPPLPAPAGLSPGPGGLGVPFSRRTRLPLARAAPAEGNPGSARSALPAAGTAGARPGRPRCLCRSTRPPGAARYPGSGTAAPRDQAPRPGRRRAPRAAGRGACRQPRAPCLTLGAGAAEDLRQRHRRRRRLGAPRAEAQRRGAPRSRGERLPQWPSSRRRAPRPPRPRGGG